VSWMFWFERLTKRYLGG